MKCGEERKAQTESEWIWIGGWVAVYAFSEMASRRHGGVRIGVPPVCMSLPEYCVMPWHVSYDFLLASRLLATTCLIVSHAFPPSAVVWSSLTLTDITPTSKRSRTSHHFQHNSPPASHLVAQRPALQQSASLALRCSIRRNLHLMRFSEGLGYWIFPPHR